MWLEEVGGGTRGRVVAMAAVLGEEVRGPRRGADSGLGSCCCCWGAPGEEEEDILNLKLNVFPNVLALCTGTYLVVADEMAVLTKVGVASLLGGRGS